MFLKSRLPQEKTLPSLHHFSSQQTEGEGSDQGTVQETGTHEVSRTQDTYTLVLVANGTMHAGPIREATYTPAMSAHVCILNAFWLR